MKAEDMDESQEQGAVEADPRMLARQVALDVADESDQVGDFVHSIPMDDGVEDFRFACLMRGYEGWQWSVTLYHDVERGQWSVDESSLVPTETALRHPAWVPWKDRLRSSDLSMTDALGTDPNDPRLEDGFLPTRKPADAGHSDAADTGTDHQGADHADATAADGAAHKAAGAADGVSGATADHATSDASADADADEDGDEDTRQVTEEFALTRRHVLSPLGRSQTAKRWYEGPHGPKSLSTRTAGGKVCETCGFMVPLQGELGTMFGVCANAWSPDDGRVVSLDHGCGEHSEIEPPETAPLWVQSKPAFDDLHIDILDTGQRGEHGHVELLESLTDTDPNEIDDDDDHGDDGHDNERGDTER